MVAIGGGKTAMVIFPVSAHIPLLAITEYEVVVKIILQDKRMQKGNLKKKDILI